MKLLLISSSGGHFNALCQLASFWQNYDRQWVTFPTATTRNYLAQEKVHWAFGPTNRNFPNLCRNLGLAARIIHQEQPDMVITTGAGVAVPFLLFAKLLGIKTVFIESFTRVNDLSLSAKLILPCIDVLYVQWEQLQQRYPQAKLIKVSA
ncbi:PssD/Cps14F family polysaccharide biosynthesis glycosyltransferase [Synechocystis sp. CACIAM 05]|uniref:PssD/Cps14F family polysaccharide biosynthesis glycosyltransferase n=1 Tax=Synechocystis sp. CACIAM 05 TaxID=1933929 RepID=UPI00138E7B3A|nr:PssD/Cps14F family polysaccharide biosynthesis glycosyltransferase [Synechocystis sp. CACIAM 05]QHU98895.1 UDP-N-acetylglucosamine--LPS N-acetylglucosamine transferase [Synechocystis sp. CACIAM 05]